MLKKKDCIICKKKIVIFFEIKNFLTQSINNKKINKLIKTKNLKLYFCNSCKNISTYPIIKNSILYSNFNRKNFKFYEKFKFTLNFIRKNNIKKNNKILEISKYSIFDREILKKKKIKLVKINILDPLKSISSIQDFKIDYVYCYDFIGNIYNLKKFFILLKQKISDNGKIFLHHHYGPSIIENLNIDRIYFEHRHFLSLTAIQILIKNINLEILKFNLKENNNFFEIEISNSKPRNKKFDLCKFINQEKKINLLKLKRFKKNIQNLKKNIRKFLKSKKKYSIIGFGASIGALPIINCFKLQNKIEFLVDDFPLMKKFYLKKNYFLKVYKSNNINKKNIKPKIIFILAPRYFSYLKKNLINKLSESDFIVNLLPKFIYCKRN